MPDDEKTTPTSDTPTSTAEVFALVGHEIRAEIIGVLGDPDRDGGWELSFGDIRSQLTKDVEPSNLHYHLQQLVGHFVARNDDGYHLRPPGVHLCWALRAGSFDRREQRVSVAADFDCHYCQAPVEAIFDNGKGIIQCPDCEVVYEMDVLEFPLTVFEDDAAAFSYFRRCMVLKNLFLAEGVCPNCTHPVSPAIHSRSGVPGTVCIHPSCNLCGAKWDQTIGRALLADPELIAFCYENAVDILSKPHWELEFAATDNHVTVRSTDPWKVALEVTFDDETLELVVDGDLNVIERNRTGTVEGDHPILLDEVVLPGKTECLGYIRRHRWSDGVTCPSCNSADTIKKGSTGQGAQRYKCNSCHSTFNDLTDTIFAEHHLSLPEMFFIIQAMGAKKSTEIANQLDRSHDTIVDFVYKVEQANAHDGFTL